MFLIRGRYTCSFTEKCSNRVYPHIAKERQDNYHQLIILESLFEVAMKNAGDSPGHATTGTANAEHVADQAKRTA